MPSPALERRRLLLAILLALVPYALLAWRFDFVSDDAYISFRYSRYLAAGEGLVFNLGRPPVEGYSNFLWTVYLALFERAGLDITLGARWTSALCGALLIACVTTVATRRLGLGFRGALATGLFLGVLPPMGLWATSGLETMPTALLVFGTYALLLADPARPRGTAAALCALGAVLMRADGLGFVGLVLCAGFLLWQREGRPKRLLRALGTVGALALAGFVALTLWRYFYYGEWVPNTAKVKAGFSPWRLERGLYYAATFFLVLPALALVLLLALRRWPAGTARLWLPAGVLISGNLAYAIWIGGDFMPFGRFLLPLLPFSALLFAGVWSRSGGGRRALAAPLLATLCVLQFALAAFDVNPVPQSVRARPHFRADRAWQSEVERWRDMNRNVAAWELWGRALALHTRPGESIVLGGIGAVGYYSELVILDLYGLVTPEVLIHARPRELASPGHDLRVESSVFLPMRPTYAGALVALERPLEPGEALPEWAFAAAADIPRLVQAQGLAERVRIERKPLPELGFPPHSALYLLRFERWD